MTIRSISFLAAGGIGLLALAAPAGAAVTVLGSGLSQDCFQAAEFGGNPADGIKTCSDALGETAMSTHDRAATLINRGILRSRNDDSAGAMDDYNGGLALNADLGEGYVDRGAAEIVLKDFNAALADINKGIDLKANKIEIAYYDRAVVDEALGDVKSAYMDYKKAVELQPDFQLANDQLMRFRVVRRRPDGA
jgi:tetratricopeptide (TPR) repeat protein